MFSRSRGDAGRHEKAEQPRPAARHAARRRTYDEFGVDPVDRDQPGPTTGPYDVADAPADVERLDLGSLQIPAVQGVEVRVQANPEGQIQQVVLVHADSALQLTALAAPRTEAVWDEVREDIRAQLSRDGVSAQEVDGEYGVELRARVRAQDGPTDVRFVGIDGPRWLVRAVFQGRAAIDPAAAGPLADCLRGLVVDRGAEAMPVLDPLPLRLPREIADQARLAQQPTGVDGAAVPGGSGPGTGGAGAAPGGAGGEAAAGRAGGGSAPSGGGSAGGGKRRPKPRRR